MHIEERTVNPHTNDVYFVATDDGGDGPDFHCSYVVYRLVEADIRVEARFRDRQAALDFLKYLGDLRP